MRTDKKLRPTLLLLDDNAAVLTILVEMLEKDYVVTAFSDGASLLAEFGSLSPELVILDISLGAGMTGLEVARTLQDRQSPAKIIFLTVHEDHSFVDAAFDLGSSGYVFKSRADEDLKRAIEQVLEGGRFLSESD